MLKFKKLKYRHKVAASIFLFSLLPMVILGSFLIQKVWNSKVEDILANNRVQLTNSVNSIDNLLSSNLDKLLYINNNFYINNYLETNTDQNLIGIMSFSDYLQSAVYAIMADSSHVDLSIYALKDINYNGEYLRSIQNLENLKGRDGKSVKDEVLEFDSNSVLWQFRSAKEDFNSEKELEYIFGYKKIISLNKPLAITEIRIPFYKLTQDFKEDIPNGSFIVFDFKEGQRRVLIKSNNIDLDLSAKPLEHYHSKIQKDYYTLSLGLKSGMGKFSMFIPKKLVFQDLKLYLVSILVIFIVIIVLLFVTVEVVAFSLTKRLEGLFGTMNTNIENLINNEDTQIYSSEDEFGTMGNMFHELVLKVKEYYKKVTDYELEKTVLETQLLQERINPHFLYNTLSTMKWISEDKRIQNVVDSMVKYYRIALNKGSSIVTITQELEMIEEYLRLQKFAYGNEFEFHIDIEDGVGKYLMLKHLLQPIVENAVLHGLNGRETGGLIIISVKRCEGNINFEISDNGAGMDQDKVEKILNGTLDGIYGGYGMRNIKKRMEVLYGTEYGIDIKSVIGNGTTVIIRIPGFLDANIHSGMKS